MATEVREQLVVVPEAQSFTEDLVSVAPVAGVSLVVTSTVIGASRLPDTVSGAVVGAGTTVTCSEALTVTGNLSVIW